jgi:ubiquinone/menaquinone biosynthesis C-methylase UbiE
VDAVEWSCLLDLLQPQPGERVLDIGSGTGRNVVKLAKRRVRAVGLEPSAGMLAEAQWRRPEAPQSYVRGVAEALPFLDGAFDAVLAVTTLEFVNNVEAAVREAVRVTRDGGRLVVGVLSSAGPWAAARRRGGDPLWKSARSFSQEEVRTLLEQFGQVETRRAVYVSPGMAQLPSRSFLCIEWLGRRALPNTAAFIAARVDVRR